jgi:hypothetical protein
MTVVNAGVIVQVVIDATNHVTVNRDPITMGPDSHIVFEIVNNHSQLHRVSIVPGEFKKKKPTDKDDPIDPFSVFWVDVPAADVGAIVLHVRPQAHFGNPNGHKHEYKYTIHWSNSQLDPALEIDN